MCRAPKKGGFLGKGRFYRKSDQNGPGEQEFWEKGMASSQLFTIMTFRIFFFIGSMKRATQNLSKVSKPGNRFFFRRKPRSSAPEKRKLSARNFLTLNALLKFFFSIKHFQGIRGQQERLSKFYMSLYYPEAHFINMFVKEVQNEKRHRANVCYKKYTHVDWPREG